MLDRWHSAGRAGAVLRIRRRPWLGAAGLGATAAVVAGLALYGPDGSLSLLDGPLPACVLALSSAGLVVGLSGRSGHWWATWGVAIAGYATLVAVIVHWWLRRTGLVDQHYPPTFLLWGWVAVAALGVAVTGLWDGPATLRVTRVLTVPVTVFASFLLVNAHYGYWPTMAALLDRPVAGQISGTALDAALDGTTSVSVGTFGPVSIPGPAGFHPGSSWVWLPPAYDRVPHARLPVLVMLPGWPGRSTNWEQAGEVVPLADAWARTHGGVAPIMVFVSGNGAADRDTECVNGTQGPAETFLARSVPRFITERLGVAPDPARWGVVGFSEGGTCAIGLATEHPGVFGRFVDISGELVPSFGTDIETTLRGLYAGDERALLHHEPMWLLATHSYRGSVGWFAAGAQDRYHERIAARLTDAAAAAGMTAYDVSGGPGDHSWAYARSVLDRIYPTLVQSMPAPPSSASAVVASRHDRTFVADPRRDDRHDRRPAT